MREALLKEKKLDYIPKAEVSRKEYAEIVHNTRLLHLMDKSTEDPRNQKKS